MGIDIYLTWEGQNEAEKEAQYTGFSVTSGDVGYLREAYHGSPYATRFFVSEAFEAEDATAAIPAETLISRLPQTVMIAIYREHILYKGELTPGVFNLDDQGSPGLLAALSNVFASISEMVTGQYEKSLINGITEEQIKAASELIASRSLPKHALAYVDFANLAAKKEAETGKPCTIIASH